jgi:hypothetical protein
MAFWGLHSAMQWCIIRLYGKIFRINRLREVIFHAKDSKFAPCAS